MGDSQEIEKAVGILRAGGVVAMPTETVYGLAGDASNPNAIKKIFSVKGRPIDHPLIVHIGDLSLLSQWASEVPEEALKLANAFWPGPMTLILKKAPSVNTLVTGGQETIGLRMPNHPVAIQLLKTFGKGLAAPSANRFGRISPTSSEDVKEELGDRVDLILEGGVCEVGVESTIVDMTGAKPRILRPGMISAKEIEAVLNEKLNTVSSTAPRVSGSLESHYAPITPVKQIMPDVLSEMLKSMDVPAAVMIRSLVLDKALQKKHSVIKMPLDPKQYAHDLYHVLRTLDHLQMSMILIEALPEGEEWEAVSDRLKRASSHK